MREFAKALLHFKGDVFHVVFESREVPGGAHWLYIFLQKIRNATLARKLLGEAR